MTINIRVDEKLTKEVVESKLEKYRTYLVTIPTHIMPTITPSYSIVTASSNQFNSKTENAAIERVEFEVERDRFINLIHRAVSTLKNDERQIVIRRYLQDEPDRDVDIWLDLNISKNKYYKKKQEALLRLAFALKIEIYRDKHTKQKQVN